METSDVELRAQELAQFIRQQMQQAPYRTLALALVAGYVLGGGLTPRLAQALMVTGGRAMAGNMVAAALRGAFDQRRSI